MRYNGSKYGNSEWSNTVVINTLEVDEKIISFWNSINNTFFQPLQFDNGDILYTYLENGTKDLILVLLDLNLNIKKSKRIKKILYGLTGILNIVKDGLGNIYLNTRIYKDSDSVHQSLIIKLDNNLNFIKSTSISGINSPHTAGYSIVYHNNYIYVAGYMNFGNSLAHMVLKLDLNLNIIKKYLGDTGTGSNCQLEKVSIINNTVYVSGHISTTNANIIGYMAIFDLDLNRLSHKAYYSYTGIAYGTIWNFIEYNNYIYATGHYRLNNSTAYRDFTPVLFKLDLNLNVIACKILNGYKGAGNGIAINQDKLLIAGDIKSDLGGTITSFILEMDQNLNIIKSLKSTNTFDNAVISATVYNNTLLLDYTISDYVELTNHTVKNLVRLDSKLDSNITLLEPVIFTWTTVNPITPVIDIIVNTTFNPGIANHTLTIVDNTPLFDIKDL